MTDAIVSRVRVRGAGARRLARVAATTLPMALDSALADVGNVSVDEVRVVLDFDPDDYDDVTVATLWAGEIRAALISLESLATRPGATTASTPQRADSRAALDIARAWLSKGGPNPVPTAILTLVRDGDAWIGAEPVSEPSIVRETVVAIESAIADRLASIAAASRGQRTSPRDAPQRAESGSDLDNAEAVRAVEPRRADGATQPDHNPPQGDHERDARMRSGPEGTGSLVLTLAELVDSDSVQPGHSVDLEMLTNAAGLALLYPWLGDLCRQAVSLHPGLDEASVRTHALVALVDPDDAALHVDPLISLLAGNPEPHVPSVPLPHAAELRQAADAVLTSFASLLPGFAASSPDFVRNEWIRRMGLVDVERDPVRLTAATHPLDVVLGALPFPLGLFKLPWSPPVMVRFRP